MGREIKFRARVKNKETGEIKTILFPLYLPQHEDSLMQNFPLNLTMFEILNFDQFTGLKDKNGKDIFEGDVVYCEDNNLKYQVKFGEYPNPHDITFNCNGWYAENDRICCCLVMTELLEVIGNIYENPELLEVSE